MAALVRSKLLLTGGALVALALALAASAAAGNGGFAPVPPESPNAGGITDAWWLITFFIAAIFVLVEGLLLLFIVRFRRGRRARDADGPQIHGATRLELAWTVGPVLILVVIAAFVFYKLPGISDVPNATAGSNNLEVTVTGHQFYWDFTYPNGAITVNSLRVPVGRTVALTVVAPDSDVIHSWWIPALGGKIDAIPGRVNHTWLEAEKAGVFQGQCAELCGILHAKMLADVVAVPPDQFDAWYAQAASNATLGRDTYVGVCAPCHGLAGQGYIGPKIQGSSILTDEKALATLVHDGKNLMPAVGSGWNDAQLKALSQFVSTHKELAGGG